MRHIRFLPDDTNIDFIGWRYYAFALDGLLMLIAIVSIAVQGFNLSIDFTGGEQIEDRVAGPAGAADQLDGNMHLGVDEDLSQIGGDQLTRHTGARS